MFSLTRAIFILSAVPSTALGVVDLSQAPDPVSRLEDRLRSTYAALPRGSEGLPDSSGVRYLARRYIEAEHGWVVKGLDTAPWLRDGPNASRAAALRASDLLAAGAERLPMSGPLRAALSPEVGRGFTLREAAEVVLALEELMAAYDAALMRRSISLSTIVGVIGHTGQDVTLMQSAIMLYTLLTFTNDEEVLMGQLTPETARRTVEQLSGLEASFLSVVGLPLWPFAAEAAQKATVGSSHPGHSGIVPSTVGSSNPQWDRAVFSGMRHLRKMLHKRQTQDFCPRLRGVLSSMDHEGSGQAEFRQAYGTKVRDWHFTETLEYLGAIGALDEKGAKGGGPGVLIPNYVSGINNCQPMGAHPATNCCPDECEANILPRLEAAAAGPRIAPKQVWAALSRLIKGDKMATAAKRKKLHYRLRALGLRSGDGLIEVHGRRLGRWLHRAFPHTCPMPVARGSPLVVDPTLSQNAWIHAGKFMPLAAEDMDLLRAHLQARWGPDGTGADPHSFAARSPMGLGQELQLAHKLHQQHKAGGPFVKIALEDAINVRVLDRWPRAEYLLATLLAAVLLGPMAAAVAMMGRILAEVCSLLVASAAAAEQLTSARRPVAPRAREGSGCGEEVHSTTGKDDSTDMGDTDSVSPASEYSDLAMEPSAEGSDSEREATGADDVHPNREAVPAVANQAEEEVVPVVAIKAEEEPDPREAPAAAEAGAAGAGRDPRPPAFPRGFRPPPGLEPPPLKAIGLGPDRHRLHQDPPPGLEPPPGLSPPLEANGRGPGGHRLDKDPPSPELAVLNRPSAEGHAPPAPPHEHSIPHPHRLARQASPAAAFQ